MGVLLAVLLVVGGGGCTVGQPDREGWAETAYTSLSDAASEVATVRLTLASTREDRIWRSYAVVVLAEAEKAVGTAEESLSGVQPPPGREADTEGMLELLGSAADEVRAARAAAVAQEPVDDAALGRLDRLALDLDVQARRWRP